MQNHQSFRTLKYTAKEKMTGRYTNAIVLFIICGLFSVFLSNSSAIMDAGLTKSLSKALNMDADSVSLFGSGYVFGILFSILQEIFQVGITLFYLRCACSQPNIPGNIFYGFYENSGRSFQVATILTAAQLICFIPFYVLRQLMSSNPNPERRLLYILIILQLVLLVAYIIFYLTFSQCYFLMLDFPEKDTKDIFRLSHKIMKKNRLRLLLLKLSFLPLFILCIPTFGIGLLWLLPYISTTNALFYLDLMQEA